MQNFAKFVDLNYIPGSDPTLVQGIKYGRTPRGTLGGSNGSFIVQNTPSKLILTVEADNGEFFEFNIISVVRNVLDCRSVRANLRSKLEKAFSSAKFELSDGYINNLADIIKTAK